MEPIEVSQDEFMQEYVQELIQKNAQLEQVAVQLRVRNRKLEAKVAELQGEEPEVEQEG